MFDRSAPLVDIVVPVLSTSNEFFHARRGTFHSFPNLREVSCSLNVLL